MKDTVTVTFGRRVPTAPQDLAYVRAHFRAAGQDEVRLPGAAYYDEAGTAYVPYDYESQETDRERFYARARAEISRLGLAYGEIWIDDVWAAYADGIYQVCLQSATPENIVRKNALIDRIEALASEPYGENAWAQRLRDAVERLDAIERPFCAYDREYFGGSVSRDRCITAIRERLPAVFA
jgi:hypothetical protein